MRSSIPTSPPREPLPLTVTAVDGEAGMSYVLRTFNANGVSLGRASEWLGFRIPQRLSSEQVRLLAWVTSVSRPWLQFRLLRSGQEHGQKVWEYLGHRFRPGPWALDQHTPICPRCLHSEGICQAIWSFAGYCCCPVHGCALSDRCITCGRAIGWDRPAVDVCRCRHPYVTPKNCAVPISDRVLAWAAWIRLRLESDAHAHTQALAGAPPWLNALSLDAALRVVHAFGLLSKPHEAPATAELTRLLAPHEMCRVVDRGLTRLARFEDAQWQTIALAPSVYLAGLHQLHKSGILEGDRSIAGQIVEVLTSPARRRLGGRARQGSEQLSLFDAGGPNA